MTLPARADAHRDKIAPRHRERRAYVYVRQSISTQVRQNRTSQENQYALVERARNSSGELGVERLDGAHRLERRHSRPARATSRSHVMPESAQGKVVWVSGAYSLLSMPAVVPEADHAPEQVTVPVPDLDSAGLTELRSPTWLPLHLPEAERQVLTQATAARHD